MSPHNEHCIITYIITYNTVSHYDIHNKLYYIMISTVNSITLWSPQWTLLHYESHSELYYIMISTGLGLGVR